MDVHRTDPSHEGSTHRLALVGELDLAGVLAARAAVHDVLSPGLVVELDLASVTFMDSAGARFLVWAGRSAQVCGGRAVLTALSHPARGLLLLARADQGVRAACTWSPAG